MGGDDAKSGVQSGARDGAGKEAFFLSSSYFEKRFSIWCGNPRLSFAFSSSSLPSPLPDEGLGAGPDLNHDPSPVRVGPKHVCNWRAIRRVGCFVHFGHFSLSHSCRWLRSPNSDMVLLRFGLVIVLCFWFGLECAGGVSALFAHVEAF